MTRAALLSAAIGVFAGTGWILLAWDDASGAWPSYVASWLFWIGLPLGALPLVLGSEALGWPADTTPALRRLLRMLPIATLLAIPAIWKLAQGAPHPVAWRAAAWMAPGAFVGRAAVVLVVLSAMALVFSGTPRRGPRRRLAMVGLGLHVCLVSVACLDWVLALEPGPASSATAPLLMSMQAGAAGAFAVLLVGARGQGKVNATALLSGTLGAWAFLHFTQYLVAWSANLPTEAAWYLARLDGAGAFSVRLGVVICALALIVLITPLRHTRAAVLAVAAMLLAVHLVEALWLITPAFRRTLVVTWSDVLAIFAVGGIVVLPLLWRHASDRMERHAAA